MGRGAPIGINNGNSFVHRHFLEIQAEANRNARSGKLEAEELEWIYKLIDVDPEGGAKWYDNDENVPAWGTRRARIELIKARIKQLEADDGKHIE